MQEFEDRNAEILKGISAAAINDAYVLRSRCFELDKNLNLKSARMAEEATTLNFIRRLVTANRFVNGFNAGAILHSRQLESFHSKADLELVIKFSPNSWLNLVLQAKSLQWRSGTWRYEYWNATKNAELIYWCKTQSRVRGRKLTPGMLLYNEDVPVFRNTVHRNPFGACDLTKRYTAPVTCWSSCCLLGYPHLAPEVTPAGISLCLDENMMTTLAKPTPIDLVSSHFPLEHLAHFVQSSAGSGTARKVRLNPRIEKLLSADAPVWARKILERGEPEVGEFKREVGEGVVSTGYVAIDLSQR
ncbi:MULTISPECIES: hypothetical protein [Corynebacterium]|uniref:hypothetical protein n=1 Tax=Corynebacterium TaxID=1716 RepID=UPI00114CBB25|nr:MULTISPECIES: hypothetical protein [Corynebacterium]MDK8664902.1 hypothetical protein [Corynebacterium coyleae]MDK8708013.1 hypothetical protein [Corynebacterium coyleae]MDK8734862.1 hypothetical protein [Corynebacterium coyleae]MDK8824443.1 hypothetical protein [Corynebacterium coyleae]MDK8894057.1 hypothetical protein [Corynebacterium coyleae]